MAKEKRKSYVFAVGCVVFGIIIARKGYKLFKEGLQDIADSLKSNDDLDDYDEE